jgi:predicted ribosomally synthesized peptide with nif11-like leader
MSERIAVDFIKTVNSQPILQEKVRALPFQAVDELVELAAKEGFRFSAEEFWAVQRMITSFSRSEEELGTKTSANVEGVDRDEMPRSIWGNFYNTPGPAELKF